MSDKMQNESGQLITLNLENVNNVDKIDHFRYLSNIMDVYF